MSELDPLLRGLTTEGTAADFGSIRKLAPARRRALEKALAAKGIDLSERMILRREPGADPTSPLSLAEERLWFLNRLNPQSSAFNVPLALRVTGGFDLPAFAAAWTALVLRHEVLGTRFIDGGDEDGGPRRVGEVRHRRPAQVDLAGLALGRREAELARLATCEGMRPFDLARELPVRWSAVALDRGQAALLIAFHHIACDGWSLDILVREITALYAAAARRQAPPPLPPLPIQLADFAVWQRRRLQGPRLDAEIEYWRRRLAGSPPLLNLPLDRPRRAPSSARGRRFVGRIDPLRARALDAIARRRQATFFMAHLAVFGAVLARVCGQRDVTLGTAVAGRDRVELEGLIGFFVQTLVLRLDLEGDPGLSELVARSRATVIDAEAHREVPFERLVEALAPQRDLATTPLFQAMFAASPLSGEADANGEAPWRMEILGTAEVPVQVDLYLSVHQEHEGASFALAYRAELFEPSTVRRLADHYLQFLAEATAEPERPLGSFDLLAAAERAQVTWEFPDGGPSLAVPGALLHERFVATALRMPERIALEAAEGVRWTYAELYRRSVAIAWRLKDLGAGPETCVGICLERRPEIVACLLGVLMAGGAYVPFDPGHPADRWGAIAREARIALALGEGPAGEGLAELGIHVEPPSGQGGAVPEMPPRREAEPENLAYVLFTSGSTGEPKGVALSHRSACALVAWSLDRWRPESWDGVLASTSIGFDLSVYEIFAPLSCGGRLVWVRDALELAERVPPGIVRLINTVPSVMAELLAADAVPATARIVNLAGEALAGDLSARLRAETSVAEIYNLYGPTETATYSTWHRVAPERTGDPPVGRPLAGTRAYVLDPELRAVGIGRIGELWIGGAGLARGYLGRADLTALRFAPEPFGEERGGRIYRTGDLARWQPDGELDLHGRIDGQVKLRGFRIELGEIEAVLRKLPGVREAAAAVVGEGAERRLIAWVVGAPDLALEPAREALRATLPSYMVPASIVPLPSMPLGPRGKLDRRALAATVDDAAGRQGPTIRPVGSTEEIVAGLLSEVLGREEVGANDDFFALGGHSLLALRVMTRIERAFGIELSLRALFEAPTVAGLARRIESAREERSGSALSPRPPLAPADRSAPLPLSFSQRRFWLFQQLAPESAAYNVPLALTIEGSLDLDRLDACWNALVRRHEALRTVFETVGAVEPVQRILSPAPSRVPRVDLRALPTAPRDRELRSVVERPALLPFDLGLATGVRAIVALVGERRSALALCFHHAIVDRWSLEVLDRDLNELYRASTEGRPARLPALPIQVADHAAWQRATYGDDRLERELAHWQSVLKGAPDTLDLPFDRTLRTVPSAVAGRLDFGLPAGLGATLAAVARRSAATPFLVACASWHALLTRLTGERRVSVGTPTTGRDRVELEPLIGCFVNTLVVHADLGAVETFAEAIAVVRGAALSAFEHRDLPFEILADAQRPGRRGEAAPWVPTAFALGARSFGRAPAAEGSHPTFRPLAGRVGGAAKFPLLVAIEEQDEELVGTVEYETAWLDPATAIRTVEHWRRLLGAALAAPTTRLADLPLLGDGERHQLTREWNDTSGRFVRRGLFALFAEVAAADPRAPAAIFGGTEISYGELLERARNLGRNLAALGVSTDVRVGLLFERSLPFLVSVLGTLAAGGAYVPLDPSHPLERLSTIARDAGLLALLTTADRLPLLAGLDARCLAFEALELGRDGDRQAPYLPVEVPAEALAYVVYTSGSTGRPKGVGISQEAVCRLVLGADYVPFSNRLRIAFASNPAFDAATFEIWGTLLVGGCLVGLTREEALDPAESERVLVRYGATTMFATTALFQQTGRETPSAFAMLDHLLFGGEAVDPVRVREILSREVRPRRVLHVYGPTECTTFATRHKVEEVAFDAVTVPIGRPLANTVARVVDLWGSEAPIGAPGELWLGGAGLARGYLGSPDLTATRFVPDPFSQQPGARSYRTGDRVRRLGGGEIEFLNRLDGQVKIRGFRVELGEVESALAEGAGVKDAAAAIHVDPLGERILVGYVVLRDAASELDPERMKRELSKRLPPYMVPVTLVRLDRLPLTPNGKLDRRALPAPDPENVPRAAVEPPRTPLEAALLDLWHEVLGVRGLGIADDFFEAGGHSLTAVRLSGLCRDRLALAVPVRAIFEHPTVERLAAALDARPAEAADPLGAALATLGAMSDDEVRSLIASTEERP